MFLVSRLAGFLGPHVGLGYIPSCTYKIVRTMQRIEARSVENRVEDQGRSVYQVHVVAQRYMSTLGVNQPNV